MAQVKYFFICMFAFLNCTRSIEVQNLFGDNTRFPDDFLFGTATSAYQIEGGWNADGKGPSIWDEFTHTHPEKIADGQNGDVGPDSYHYFEDDIKAVKSLGMDLYRFSIAWARVLPDGDVANINEEGIEYYNKLINELLENGIEPMVTMCHNDLPQELQKFGGFTNSIVIRYFEAYANLMFDRFGDRVKHWITFNEPHGFCLNGYGIGILAPGLKANGIGEYLCGHNMLKAHAIVYNLYKERYYSKFKGQVGITINTAFYYSATNNSNDVDRAMRFSLGWIAHPIFSASGNYPEIMSARIASNSIQEGRSWSRLPVLSERWIKMIQGSADFLGINYYTSRYVESLEEPMGENPSYYRDIMMKESVRSEWKQSKIKWLYSVPSGLGDLLRWIKREYNDPQVYITENGWSDDGQLDDMGRIDYLRGHLKEILKVVLNNECNLKGYIAWSLIDNFEWSQGYTEKFGLFAVNMTSPRKERIPKKSAEFMHNLILTRQIPDSV